MEYIDKLKTQNFEEIKEKLKDKKQFTDEIIGPNRMSVCSNKEWLEKYNKIDWIRATKIPSLNDDDGNLMVFDQSIEPNDVLEGILNDSYFLSALSTIAAQPLFIRKIFHDDSIHNEGMFGISLYGNG